MSTERFADIDGLPLDPLHRPPYTRVRSGPIAYIESLQSNAWGGIWLLTLIGYLPGLIIAEEVGHALGLGLFLTLWALTQLVLIAISWHASPKRTVSAATSEPSPVPAGDHAYPGIELNRVDIAAMFPDSWIGRLSDSELSDVTCWPSLLCGLASPSIGEGTVWGFRAVSNVMLARGERSVSFVPLERRKYPSIPSITIAGPDALLPPTASSDWVDAPDLSLTFTWRVAGADAALLPALMSPPVLRALSEVTDRNLVIHLSARSTLVAKAGEGPGAATVVDTALALSAAVKDTRPALEPEYSRLTSQGQLDLVRLGRLATKTLSRNVPTFAFYEGIAVLALSAFPFFGIVSDGPSKHQHWLAMLAVSALWVVLIGCATVFARRTMRRLQWQQRQTALAAIDYMRRHELEFRFLPRDGELETGWLHRPFSRAKRLECSPSVRSDHRGLDMGIAYLEGDLGMWPASRALTSRIAWARLPEGTPDVDIIPERFSTRVATLFGGQDIDVESYQFNRTWRVRAADPRAAHGLLSPTVIEAINTIAEEGLALHLDGGRIVLWDDGRADQVDLDRRLEIVERFARSVPDIFR